jgi:hypothetical protein
MRERKARDAESTNDHTPTPQLWPPLRGDSLVFPMSVWFLIFSSGQIYPLNPIPLLSKIPFYLSIIPFRALPDPICAGILSAQFVFYKLFEFLQRAN